MRMTTSEKSQRRGLLRTLLLVLGAVAAIIVLGIVALLVFVKTDAVEARVRDRILPQLSERIGREVTVGPIDVSVLPVPTAKLEEIRVAGISEQPLLAAKSARARIDLWRLLVSLGKEVRVSSLDLRGAEINLIRLPNGEWDFRQILDRLAREEKQAPASRGGNRKVSIDRLHIENGALNVIDQSAPGGTAVAGLHGIEATARHIGPGLPLSLQLRAALQSETPNLEAKLQIDPLPVDLASLGPGHWPKITGSLNVRDAPLGSLRNLLPASLGEVATGGSLRLDGKIETRDERYYAKGSGGIQQLRLRGEPADARFGYAAQVDPQTKAMQLDFSDLAMQGPGVDLGGTAAVRNEPLRFEFALAGPLLDLDTLLGTLQEPGKREQERQGPLVPESLRRRLGAVAGSGTLAIDRLVSGKLTANDVKARATLRNGELLLEQAQAQFYGGTVKADGTTANLLQAVPSWHLQAQMAGVSLERAMDAIAGAVPLSGSVGSTVDLRGAGTNWEALRPLLTGTASLDIEGGKLVTLNLDNALANALGEGLRLLGQQVAAGKLEQAETATALRNLQTRVQVQDGWMTLQQPLALGGDFGTAELNGRIGLDWKLDLSGTAQLSPTFVSNITGGALRPSSPVAVPLRIGGTLRAPAVSPIEGEALARALLPTGQVEQRVQKGIQSGEEKARREAQRQIEKGLRGRF